MWCLLRQRRHVQPRPPTEPLELRVTAPFRQPHLGARTGLTALISGAVDRLQVPQSSRAAVFVGAARSYVRYCILRLPRLFERLSNAPTNACRASSSAMASRAKLGFWRTSSDGMAPRASSPRTARRALGSGPRRQRSQHLHRPRASSVQRVDESEAEDVAAVVGRGIAMRTGGGFACANVGRARRNRLVVLADRRGRPLTPLCHERRPCTVVRAVRLRPGVRHGDGDKAAAGAPNGQSDPENG